MHVDAPRAPRAPRNRSAMGGGGDAEPGGCEAGAAACSNAPPFAGVLHTGVLLLAALLAQDRAHNTPAFVALLRAVTAGAPGGAGLW